MKSFTRNWWGKKFIEDLEDFTDSGRLSRGRTYARNGKIISYQISKGKITAKVKGSINPYFDVYDEPIYKVNIKIKLIDKEDWTKVIKIISSRASFISRLLLNEMPDNIQTVFKKLSLNLLPNRKVEFETECSCPDFSNPCKHIAGVYYLVAQQFDYNPFLIFELRGLTIEELQQQLSLSALGKILLVQKEEVKVKIEESSSYYTELKKEKTEKTDFKEFWIGKKKLPTEIEYITESSVTGALIKKQGDFPPFWDKDISFIETMEEIYKKVKHKRFT